VNGFARFQLVQRCAEVFEVVAIGLIQFAVRSGRGEKDRQPVDDRAKPSLARAQRFLRLHSFVDIDTQAAPFHNLSGCIRGGVGAKQEPAIFSVRPAQARLRFGRRARCGSPAGEQPGQVLRVDGSLPPAATGLLNPKPGVIGPALIEKVDLPVWERGPYHSRERIDDAAQLALHYDSLRDHRGALSMRPYDIKGR